MSWSLERSTISCSRANVLVMPDLIRHPGTGGLDFLAFAGITAGQED